MPRSRLPFLYVHKSLFLILLFGVLFVSCLQNRSTPEQEVAITYCQSCHLLPNPQDINRETWNSEVLPKMAARLGYEQGDQNEIQTLKKLHLFPDSSAISSKEWEQLKAYFLEESPLFTGPSQDTLPITITQEAFLPVAPMLGNTAPFLTMLHYDQSSQQLIYGNDVDNSLNFYDPKSGNRRSMKLGGAPSHMIRGDSGLFVLTMGKVMPHHEKTGTVVFIPQGINGREDSAKIILDSLQRPVHASLGDLNSDGKEDLVVASFGNYNGELAWYSDIHSPMPQKHMLRPLPGAIKSIIEDVNDDGLPDILALMAQGDEGFFLYLNEGNGSFREKSLLRFPPTYGSTYFKWLDMDGDGRKDILYVNGDNGDYAPIVKPYHGIRLFRNIGEMRFEEAFFLEQHGAFKAEVEDFDQDGDLDIAAISYFPDYQNRAKESYVYYQNLGDYQFKASTFESQPGGKWLTMTSGDMDQDGDIDIMLGNSFFMTSETPPKLTNDWRRNMVSVMILQNQLSPTERIAPKTFVPE